MSLYENLFNSMALFMFTIPVLIILTTVILQIFIKKKILPIFIVFMGQVILYYGYCCIILNLKITDVYLDYVGYIAICTLVFGIAGSLIASSIDFLRNKEGES